MIESRSAIAAAVVAATVLAAQPAAAQPSPLDFDDATAVVALEFGLTADAPRQWTGEVSVSTGETLFLWGRHFSPGDRVTGSHGFDFEARSYSPADAPYRPPYDLPNGRTVLPNGIYVSLKAPDSATLSVETNHGRFSFTLGELRRKGRLSFLDGDVAAVFTPPVRALTRGEASQHDFPAAAYLGDDLYVAWTTYHNEANVVYLARLSGGQWTTKRVTDGWGDRSGTAIAADGDGGLHVIWSEYEDGRWRLIDRVYEPSGDRWEDSRYIAPAGDRQYFPRAVTDASGRPWVVWQSFGEQNLDIQAAYFADGRWSEPLSVSASSANDWAPSLAAAPDGSVWFAWDGYEAGNYDVYVRSFRNGALDAAQRLTQAPTRDAYPSIAVDSKNRVWVAWAEAGPRWGKDWGVLGKPGTQLREDSRIRLARLADGKWTEPSTPLESAVPAWMGDHHEYPTLFIGTNDAPYVGFRHFMHRLPILEHALTVQIGEEQRPLQPWYDTIRGMSSIHLIGFDGARWLPSRPLPLSDGGAYAQLSGAVRQHGTTLVWPSDGRSYLDPHVRTSQLRYADFPMNDRLAADEAMRPFASPPGAEDVSLAAEQRDLERIRAVRWDDAEPLRLFRGDLHRHTDLSADSELDGDILYAYRYALDAGGLDFLAVTDHSGAERLHYYRYQWHRTRQIATMFNRPGRFAAFFGYERTVTYPGGHRNVISTRRDLQPTLISDEEFTGAESWAERLYPNLLSGGDIAIAHTTAGGGGTDWRDGDVRAEPVVEIFQGLRGSYEEPGSPGAARGSNRPAGFVWNAWQKGRRLGVIANSDHTSTHQSYACVYAPRLTAESIHAGLKRRLTYGATDNIVLQFEATDQDGRAHKMGAEITTTGAPRFNVRVEAPSAIAKLELIRAGEIVHAIEPGAAESRFSFVDNEASVGESYYHVRLVQQDGQIAWSSPIWVRLTRD